MDRATRRVLHSAPKYIVHQGREFYCIRRNPGITSRRIKWRVTDALDDRRYERCHVPLKMMLSMIHSEIYRPAYKRFAEKRMANLR